MICGNCENGEFCKCIDCDQNFDCGATCATCPKDEEKNLIRRIKNEYCSNA